MIITALNKMLGIVRQVKSRFPWHIASPLHAYQSVVLEFSNLSPPHQVRQKQRGVRDIFFANASLTRALGFVNI